MTASLCRSNYYSAITVFLTGEYDFTDVGTQHSVQNIFLTSKLEISGSVPGIPVNVR